MQNGFPGPGNPRMNYRRNEQPLYVETNGYVPQYAHLPPPPFPQPNEVDPGMNGDGWQGPGGRGGAHHMNSGGGGRRGGGMHNQRMAPGQHHGGMSRGMLPPGFRHQPQQSQFMGGYPPMGGMPPPPGDMIDISMRMGDMSLASTPSLGAYGQEMPPPPPPQNGGWNQPTPFGAGPQEDLYADGGYGGGGNQNMPPHHVPFGQRGGGNQYGGRMQQNNRQGGYQQRNHQNGGYIPPMMGPPMSGNQPFYGGNNQQSFAPSPFSIPGGGSASQMGGHVDQMGGGQNGGFQVNSSSMDDYSMWTDENDEDAKRKKILRDKGLLAWGDADVSNSKPIRRWIVPEGQEEDFDTAMARCPSHLKKKTLNEEALRRRLGSDNPQIVAQAQQQVEEEANAAMKIGRRPIIPCGWGDLPPDMMGEKSDKSSDFDQSSSKGGWEDEGRSLGLHQPQHGPRHLSQPNEELSGMPWNLPGVGAPSSSETRNPFFAHHMQQQAQQQHNLGFGDNGDVGGPVWSAVMDAAIAGPPASSIVGGGGMSSASGGGPPLGMLSMVNGATDGVADGSQMKLAEHLKLAVEKGHLDISLLSLPHIPPNVLDLLTEILTVIPRLDAFEDELKKLGDSRPSNFEDKDDPHSWMTKDQKNENDKAVIGVVTSKIEVTQLSKKITEALVEAGLIPAPPSTGSLQSHHHQGPPPPPGGAGPSTSSNGGGAGGPPEHYYDYSFLG